MPCAAVCSVISTEDLIAKQQRTGRPTTSLQASLPPFIMRQSCDQVEWCSRFPASDTADGWSPGGR